MLPNEPLPTSDGSSLVIRGMGVGVAGVVGTEPADHDVRRLDVPVDQATSVRLAERVTDPTQQVDRAPDPQLRIPAPIARG
jgi:hypothetical protein